MSEENKAVVRRGFEAFNSGNLDILDEVYAQEVKYHGAVGVEIGSLEGLKEYLNAFRTAFPDIRVTVESSISEGDLVATHATAVGTHEGELGDIAPTGKRAEGVRGFGMYRVRGGKIVEEWEVFDQMGMMQQLGVIP